MTHDVSVDALVVGGGLAGLSAAYHLRGHRILLVERDAHPGGTARSFVVDGFTFDITGHLLHLHNDYTRRLIKNLLGGSFFTCERRARIFSNGVETPYPFQANTYGLPESVVEDCVLGYLDAYRRNKGRPVATAGRDFDSWSRSAFGDGINRHFMRPYNEKLYQVRADRMTAEWCGQFVPVPRLEDVIRGACLPQEKRFGYNTTFIYPKRGGIQVLAEALARRCPRGALRLSTTVTRIDLDRREALLSDGTLVHYRELVNTIPLPEFLKLCVELPPAVKKDSALLRSAGILCLNLGIGRARISDASWIYYPEKEFLFYRVGFPMNFTPHVVPRGCSSMYVELPMRDIQGLAQKAVLARVKRDLCRARILRPSDSVKVAHFLPVKYAYVIYDKNRSAVVARLMSYLKTRRAQSIGRYGGWKYSFMEEAILDGRAAAGAIEGAL